MELEIIYPKPEEGSRFYDMKKVDNDIIACTALIRTMSYLQVKDQRIEYRYIINGKYLKYHCDEIHRPHKYLSLNRLFDTPAEFYSKQLGVTVKSFKQLDFKNKPLTRFIPFAL